MTVVNYILQIFPEPTMNVNPLNPWFPLWLLILHLKEWTCDNIQKDAVRLF